MVFDFSSSSSSSALGSTPKQQQDCNFLVARRRNLFSFSSAGGSSGTSESEVEYNVETIGAELGYRLSNAPSPPIPVAASTLERVIILSTALYASLKLVSIMATNEVGRIEGLDLILLSVWTWFVYSFGFPFSSNEEKLFHRLWGTDESIYRNDVDDGAFYGTLLIPTVAAAKLVDTNRSSPSPSSFSNYKDSSMGMQVGFPN